MKKILSLLLLCLVLSSCGLFRNVKKDTYEHDVKTSEKMESTSTIEEKTIDKGSTVDIDKGQVVTEKKNTKVTETPGVTVSVGADMVKLKNGETVSFDSLGVKIKVGLDSLTGIVKIDATMPPSKTTETNEEKITENKNRQKEETRDKETNTKQEATNKEAIARQESLDTDNTEKTPKNTFWYAFIVAFIVAAVGFFVYLVKKIKR